MSSSERRNTFRLPISMAVSEEYRSEIRDAVALNISEHGMYYLRKRHAGMRAGKEVMLTFTLPNTPNTIKVLSWVVKERQVENLIGTHVTFMFLPEKDESVIREYVDAHSLISSF